MIGKIGQLIEHVTEAVRNFGIDPHSVVVCRVGEFGPEMPIEMVKVQGAFQPKLVIQIKDPT